MAGGGVKNNYISVIGGANGKTPTFKIENGHLYNTYGDPNSDSATWHDLGQVKGSDGYQGQDGVGIQEVTIGQDGTSFDFEKTDGDVDNVPFPMSSAQQVSEHDVAELVALSIAIGSVSSGATPSVSVDVVGGEAQMNFVLPKGDTGSTGADGVGISTISVSGGYLVFNKTDGTSQTVALPVYDGTGD